MTDNCVSQARARLSRVAGAVFAALVVLSTAGISVHAKHAMSFVATDLGTLGSPQDGSTSEAFGVNEKGRVIGVSTIGSDPSVFHAFLWSEEAGLTDLGTLLDGTQSTATAISDNGVIVGFGPAGAGGPVHAFVRTHGNGVVDLTTLGGSTATPTAINARGDVVGSSDLAGDDAFHAFLWTKQDGIRDLGTLGGFTSIANAINDDRVVVGQSATAPDNIPHAFLWTRHTGEMVDLGTLGGLNSAAQAVGDDGVVAGSSQTTEMSNGQQINHAFVWTHRTGMVDIGNSGDADGTGVASFGEKINGRFVIGHFTKNNATHGFIWTRKGGFVDVGTLAGDTTSFVTGVNDQGVVVGNSIGGGSTRAFVWSASTGITQLSTPLGGSSRVNAISDNFIVGATCGADLICHATLWKPASHSHGGRGHDGDDD